MTKYLILFCACVAMAVSGLVWWWVHPVYALVRVADANPVAAWRLGEHYAGRQPLREEPVNLGKARKYHLLAAGAGHIEALRLVARAALAPDHPYLLGGQRAVWLERWARSGDAEGMHLYAIHLDQHGGAAEASTAADWFRRAAVAGHPAAMYTHANALGAAGQEDAAFTWLLRAAQAGDPPAQYAAAMALRARQSGDTTDPRADAWITAAAHRGYQPAILEAARIYLRYPSRQNRRAALPHLDQLEAARVVDVIPLLAQYANFEEPIDAVRDWNIRAMLLGEFRYLTTFLIRLQRAVPDEVMTVEALAWQLHAERIRPGTIQAIPDSLLRKNHRAWDTHAAEWLAAHIAERLAARVDPADPEAWDLLARRAAGGRELAAAFAAIYTACADPESHPASIADNDAGSWHALGMRLANCTEHPAARSEGIHWLRHAGKLGHAEAYMALYRMHAGDVPPDAALQHLRAAAELKHAGAMRMLLDPEQCGMDGIGALSETVALRYLAELAGLGDADAAAALEAQLAAGKGLDHTHPRIVQRVAELAEAGHAAAAFHLAGGRNAQFDNPAQRRWLEAAAEAGHPEALYMLAAYLGWRARDGDRRRQATELLHRAAAAGHLEAAYYAALETDSILRSRLDLASATRNMRFAAENGYFPAVCYFRDLLEAQGRMEGHEQDNLLEIYYLATEHEDPAAMVSLAREYLIRDQLRDIPEGQRLLEAAAAKSHPKAFHTLMRLHLDGEHVEKDNMRALRWAEAGARLGDAECQYFAGMAYILGQIVVQDAAKGRAYLQDAAAQDHLPAQEFIDNLQRMSGDGVAARDDASMKWLTKAAASSGDIFPLAPHLPYQGALLPVIDVQRNAPVVQWQGRPLALPADSQPVFRPADIFHPGEPLAGKATAFSPFLFTPAGMLITNGDFYFELKLQPRQAMRNVIVLLLLAPDKKQSVFWRRMDNLKPGRESTLRIRYDQVIMPWDVRGVMLFNEGGELLTTFRVQAQADDSQTAMDFFKERLDHIRMHAGADSNPVLWRPMPLFFRQSPADPETCTARLRVNEKGYVTDVTLPEGLGPELRAYLFRELYPLRFMPRVRNGAAVASICELPLSLR
jgi:TPR repeat protein